MAPLSTAASCLRILPLASTLSPPDQVRATIDAVSRSLDAHGIAHAMEMPGAAAADALFIVTGGTEHHALEALDRARGPVLLIAHAERNSLPAALEILGRARQSGRTGCICLLSDRAGGFEMLARLASHLSVRRRLMSARLGRIGAPSDWLVASMPDAATVEDAWGPRVVDVPIDEVLEAMGAADPADAAAVRRDFVSGASAIAEPSPDDIDRAARVTVALRNVAARHRLDACAVRCFDLVTGAHTTGCLALSWLLDHGVTAGCEGDLPATITMMWMGAMSGGPAFLANPQDVDPGANTVSLAHCTVARRMVSGYALRSHFESSIGVGIAGVIDPGDATVARIGGADLRALWVSDAAVVGRGDHPRRCRTQVQVRLSGDAGAILTQPLGNHLVLARGHWAAALQEYHGLFVSPQPCTPGAS
jgi:L-fucose isomerase-like protein